MASAGSLCARKIWFFLCQPWPERAWDRMEAFLSVSYGRVAFVLLLPQDGQLRLTASWNRQLGHRFGLKQALARSRQPSGPAIGALLTSTVGRYARVGVHLSIKLGDEQERQARPQRGDTIRSLPDFPQTIEAVPNFLRADSDLFRGHGRMRDEQLGA